VEIHGGTISATSDGSNKGSTFIVRLPRLGSSSKVAEHQENLTNRSRLDTSRLKGLKILLVDDDEDTLRLMTAALGQGDANVTAVTSAEAALEVLKSATPDVLISDIAMPGEDGYQLLAKIRALGLDNGSWLPAIAITAYAREEDRQQALASGFQAYLAKPIELSELIAVVADAAGGTYANVEVKSN
jgi:CheY-like chemotaxis protein